MKREIFTFQCALKILHWINYWRAKCNIDRWILSMVKLDSWVSERVVGRNSDGWQHILLICMLAYTHRKGNSKYHVSIHVKKYNDVLAFGSTHSYVCVVFFYKIPFRAIFSCTRHHQALLRFIRLSMKCSYVSRFTSSKEAIFFLSACAVPHSHMQPVQYLILWFSISMIMHVLFGWYIA